MNVVKRYIPENVYDKIQKLDYKNVEHLYVICDMIYRSTIYKKENKDYSNQFIDIPKYYFRDLIVDSKSLSLAFDLLKSNNIILSDDVYSKLGGKALGYKFNDDMISKLISVNIEKKTISKKIISNKNDRNNLVNEKLHKYRNYFLNNFKIDYQKSIDYLNNWYNNSLSTINSSYVGGNYNQEWTKLVNKYNHIFISLSAINDGDLYFRKNDTNGRIDTNLTSLKSEYKQFIISKEPLYQIDIVNSQPFILSLYLNSSYVGGILDEKELLKYNDWTASGLFYEMFERTYFKNTGKTLTRKMIKDMMFCIFYSKNGSYNKEKSIFSNVFPTISKWIEKEKENKHNEFAIKLQKIESKICIDIISQELDNEDIEYYTIHDAWLIDKEDIQKTKNIIMNKFYKYFHRRPEMKIEKINF
jgi:hypothetical protein